MTCKDFITFLMKYLEGGLPAAQKAAFEEHLSVCDSCVAYLSTYRNTVELAKTALCDPEGPIPVEAPEELVAAVIASRKAGRLR